MSLRCTPANYRITISSRKILTCPPVQFSAFSIKGAGDAQVLNLRIPRRAFGNFTNTASATANPTYVQYDEENPGLEIANP